MFTDPIQVTVSVPAEKFAGLTSTAWAAISSLIAVASTLALLFFNWRYIHWTHKISDSAVEQAEVARKSLQRLEEQIKSEVVAQRHAAIALHAEALQNVIYWSSHFRSEERKEPSSVRLVPDDWNQLVSFVSRHVDGGSAVVFGATQGLRNVESALSSAVLIPLHLRGGRDHATQFKSLESNLDDMIKRLNNIAEVLHRQSELAFRQSELAFQ